MSVAYLKPQPGPQTDFLNSPADIVFYGGAAGGGKSYALLLEMLRHWDNPLMGAVIFRRNSKQIKSLGGLWQESEKVYSQLGAEPRQSTSEWFFPKGGKIKFDNLEYDSNVYDWQGSQIPIIGFDELTHFTENQFWYMISRNRSDSGIKGYIRCTTNPDANSWVRKVIDWWIGPDGFAIKERSGVIRWFIRQNNSLIWGDTKEELMEKYGDKFIPKSFTFIPALLSDNKILMDKDPGYLSNLMAQNLVERARLLDGNWNIVASAGNFFRREWYEIINELPKTTPVAQVRFWDRAATRPHPGNTDPDWTRGLKLYANPGGKYVVVDLRSDRNTPFNIEQLIKITANHDGHNTRVVCQQDPGSAGVQEAEHFVRMLNGYDVRTRTFIKDKETRAKAISAQSEARNVSILRAPWNEEFFSELENFPEGMHDDIVDTFSGAYNEINDTSSIFDVL